MPFIHQSCGGTVGLISGKCNKCHKKFKPNSANPHSIPNGVYFESGEKIQKLKDKAASKGTTPYAKWADNKVPFITPFASRLPNWPRWARILFTVGIAVALIFGIRSYI